MNRFRLVLALIFGALIVIASFVLSRYPIDFSRFSRLGYIGIFLASALGSAPLFFPIPHPATVFAGGVLFNPLGVAISGGLGGAIGEAVGYMLGRGGRHVSKDEWLRDFRGSLSQWISRLIDRIARYVEQYPRSAIFVLAFIPNPFFDVAGIAAGFNRYNFSSFFLMTLLGKTLRSIILSYLGSRFGA